MNHFAPFRDSPSLPSNKTIDGTFSEVSPKPSAEFSNPQSELEFSWFVLLGGISAALLHWYIFRKDFGGGTPYLRFALYPFVLTQLMTDQQRGFSKSFQFARGAAFWTFILTANYYSYREIGSIQNIAIVTIPLLYMLEPKMPGRDMLAAPVRWLWRNTLGARLGRSPARTRHYSALIVIGLVKVAGWLCLFRFVHHAPQHLSAFSSLLPLIGFISEAVTLWFFVTGLFSTPDGRFSESTKGGLPLAPHRLPVRDKYRRASWLMLGWSLAGVLAVAVAQLGFGAQLRSLVGQPGLLDLFSLEAVIAGLLGVQAGIARLAFGGFEMAYEQGLQDGYGPPAYDAPSAATQWMRP